MHLLEGPEKGHSTLICWKIEEERGRKIPQHQVVFDPSNAGKTGQRSVRNCQLFFKQTHSFEEGLSIQRLQLVAMTSVANIHLLQNFS